MNIIITFTFSILFIFVIVVVTLLGIGVVESKRCLAQYEDYNSVYSFFSGCRIMYDDKLTPVENLKLNN